MFCACRYGHYVAPGRHIALAATIVPNCPDSAAGIDTKSVSAAGGDREDVSPMGGFSEAAPGISGGEHPSVMGNADRVEVARGNIPNLPPLCDFALTAAVVPRRDHGSVVTESDRMPVPGRNSGDFTPLVHLACAFAGAPARCRSRPGVLWTRPARSALVAMLIQCNLNDRGQVSGRGQKRCVSFPDETSTVSAARYQGLNGALGTTLPPRAAPSRR